MGVLNKKGYYHEKSLFIRVTFIVYMRCINLPIVVLLEKPKKRGADKMSFKNPNKLKKPKKNINKTPVKPAITTETVTKKITEKLK